MRDLILVGVTALVSASGGALLTMSLDGDAPVTAMESSDAIDIESLTDRIRLLEEMIAADAQTARSVREPVAPALYIFSPWSSCSSFEKPLILSISSKLRD